MKFLYGLLIFLTACSDSNNKKPAENTTEASLKVYNQGEELFKNNCSQCHMPAKDFAAPALAGVEKRWKDKNLLYEFVKNSQKVIERDQYAADLFEKCRQAPMLPFPQLSNTDIDAIFEYCNKVDLQQ